MTNDGNANDDDRDSRLSRRGFLAGSAYGSFGLSPAMQGRRTGSESAGTSAREPTTADRLHVRQYPIVDVRAWGATGDGETDDAPAIQAAVESMDDDGVLYFGPGRYHLGHTVTVDVETVRRIVGESAYVRLADDIVAFEVLGDSTQGSAPPTARSLGLYQNEMLPLVAGLQFYSDGPDDRYVGTGLRVKHTYGIQVRANGFHNLDTGIEFVGNSRNVLVANNQIHDNQRYGIHWNGCNIHQQLVADNFLGYSKKVLYGDGAELANLHVADNNIEGGIGERAGLRNLVHLDVTEDGLLAEAKIQGNTIQEHSAGNDALVRIDNGRTPPSEAYPSRVRIVDVVNNAFGNSAGSGLVFENVSSLRVADNAFYRCSDAHVRARGHLEDVQISDNRFAGYYLDTVFGDVVDVETPHVRGLQVNDNLFTQVAGRPVSIRNPLGPLPPWQTGSAWEDLQIADNVVRLKAPHEHALEWLDDYTLSGFVVDVANDSSPLTGVSITGNQVRLREYAENGIRVSAPNVENVLVTDNVVSGDVPGEAYDLPSGSGVVADGNLPRD